jgi:5-methylthioadenosine/S-adenosylhomocysteine deaminase
MEMATVKGAAGIGFKDVGLIRPGWAADIIVVDTDQPHYVGMDATNVPEFVVYAGSSRDVRATIVAGKILYKDGQFTTVDRDRVMSLTAKLRRTIA